MVVRSASWPASDERQSSCHQHRRGQIYHLIDDSRPIRDTTALKSCGCIACYQVLDGKRTSASESFIVEPPHLHRIVRHCIALHENSSCGFLVIIPAHKLGKVVHLFYETNSTTNHLGSSCRKNLQMSLEESIDQHPQQIFERFDAYNFAKDEEYQVG